MREAYRPPCAGTLRPLWAALLALAVFLGAVDFHPAGEAHAFGEVSGLAGSSFSRAAVHPGQPLHLERCEVASRPQCPLCLHRLQTAGGHLRTLAACALPALSSSRPAGFAVVAAGTSLHPREARAPPAVA